MVADWTPFFACTLPDILCVINLEARKCTGRERDEIAYLVAQKLTKAPLTHQIQQGRRGFLLADSLGLGKTLTSLTLVVKDMLDSPDRLPKSTMILCPDGLEESVWMVRIGLSDGWLGSLRADWLSWSFSVRLICALTA